MAARWDAPTIVRHNEEVAQLWADFEAGTPARVPVEFNFSKRFYLLTSWLNPQGNSFQDFFERPEVQWEVQLATQQWIRENVSQDHDWGLPEQWAGLAPDFQNSLEAAWFGCALEYHEESVPDTIPMLREDKAKLAGLSLPDPLQDGLMARGKEFYDCFEERREREGVSWTARSAQA